MKKQSYTRIWVHVVFSTKNGEPLMVPSVQNEIFEHFRSQLKEMGCEPRFITGMPDHVHLLFMCNPKRSVCDIVQQIKGNTSHWINDHDLVTSKFVWQRGYAAFSEGDFGLGQLVQYLENQVEYHTRRSFLQELDELIGKRVGYTGTEDNVGFEGFAA